MTEKEREPFSMNYEFWEMDGVLLEVNSEIMKKAGEICEIIGERDRAVQSLRKAYSLAVDALKEKHADLQDKNKVLEKRDKEIQVWADKYNLLLTEKRLLEQEKGKLKEKLDVADREKEAIQKEIHKLSRQEENYEVLKEGVEQIKRECSQHYTDVRSERDEARSQLEQCRNDLEEEKAKVIDLQAALGQEAGEKEEKKEEIEQLKEKLLEKDQKISVLNEENQQYRQQKQKMPTLMQLYDTYHAVMEKRDEFPSEFFECLQKVIPMDNFDRFLSVALRRSFPIACYLSLQSFIFVCSSGQVSEAVMKEALHISDQLLARVFAFGSQYFKEEGLFRISVEKNEPFDENLCTYINGRGEMYGEIADVWLHGLRDEKENKIYRSYVEGE